MEFFEIKPWIFSIITVIGLIAIEIVFSKRKNRIVGLIPILAVFVCMNALGFYTNSIQKQSAIITDCVEFGNGMVAEMKLKLQTNENIVAYSDLQIKNAKGELIDVVAIQTNNELDYRYKEIGDYFVKKYHLKNESEDIKMIVPEFVQFGETTIRPISFFLSAVLFNLPLLIIYILCKIQLRMRITSEELRLLKIYMGL